MNDKRKDKQNEKIDVTVQWYKANVVRLMFNGRVIWETEEIALDDVVRDAVDAVDSDGVANGIFRETTLHLDALEAVNYSRILLQGLQVGRLEKINLLVQLRVKQWQMKVALFEMQLKQRMVDLGFANLLKPIDPNDPDSYCDRDDGGKPVDECNNKCGRTECDGACNDIECAACDDVPSCGGECEDCDGAYCESLGIDDIPGNNDTLWLCKGCDGVRDSCAGCEDADPNDRYMNDGDSASDIADDIARDQKSKGGVGGVDLASDDDIYRRER